MKCCAPKSATDGDHFFKAGAREHAKNAWIRGFPIFSTFHAASRPQRIGAENPCRTSAVHIAEIIFGLGLRFKKQNQRRRCASFVNSIGVPACSSFSACAICVNLPPYPIFGLFSKAYGFRYVDVIPFAANEARVFQPFALSLKSVYDFAD
jgi:hypothetical protein